MNAHDLFFWMLALTTAGGALAVVLSQNVVRMAFFLVVSLASTGGLFFLLHADFLGTAQLLIYAGGTLVLLVFGVMLTASGPFMSMKTNPGDLIMSGVLGVALLGMLMASAGSVNWAKVSPPAAGSTAKIVGVTGNSPRGFNEPTQGNTTRPLGFALLGLRPDKDLAPGTGANTGTGKTSPGYLLPFEIVSVHLLVVLIGASYLARAKRRRKGDTPAPA